MAIFFRCSLVIFAAVLGIFLVARVDAASTGGVVPASFCSGNLEFETLDLIVVGRVIGWRYVLGTDGQPVEREETFAGDLTRRTRPIVVDVVNSEVYKTNPGGQLSFDDVHLFDEMDGTWKWPGDQSNHRRYCFRLQSDPTGQMVVGGFRGNERSYEYGFMWTFGPDATEDTVRAFARERLAESGLAPLNPGPLPILPPAAGRPLPDGSSGALALEVFAVACLALAAIRPRLA